MSNLPKAGPPQADNTSTDATGKPLDIVFLQDTTGSQGPYIQSARKAISDICEKISASANIKKENIRFGLIAFRDHPPQDSTYVTKDFGFTSDISVMQHNLTSLIASGGGDGPEAQTSAMAVALNLDWTENAVKMVVLITDAPPHGIGEAGDGFPNGSPDQNDPLDIARQMSERGISLFVIACEPALSRYQNAVDFYNALTELTNGRMLPLMMAERLGDYIVGTAVETIETENLIGEFRKIIVDDVYGKATPLETVMENIQQRVNERGGQINSIQVDNIYNETVETRRNVNVWHKAQSVQHGSKSVSKSTEPRMQAAFSSGKSTPAMFMAPQQMSSQQAQRVVMSSMARSSKVTAEGMASKDGKSISSSTYSPFK
ncbi:hypothetical protein B0H34DRAFT_716831 [Crassisporium funariophilum]|nr:hypothetical protein B0H34DRAFT_716831 [Crassisporium funariophilum]